MVCGCCGAKKKLFDVFFSVGENPKIGLCRACWDVVERLESDVDGGEKELYGIHQVQLKKRAKNPSAEFLAWQSTHFPDWE